MTTSKTIANVPDLSYNDIEPSKVTIKLKHPTMFSGVKYNQLTLRAPLVSDYHAIFKQAPNNETERELILFSRLSMVVQKDLEGMHLTDYQRLREAYYKFFPDSCSKPEITLDTNEEVGPGDALSTERD